MKRTFDEIINSLRTTINDYKYFTDFQKVENNSEKYREELLLLNQLIGKPQIRIDFEKLVHDRPEVLKVIPILLAKREMYFNVLDKNEIEFRFDEMTLSIEEYSKFMEETGIFYILENKKITSLIDYVIGIEVGLDSNARKNRSGELFANLVESYIKSSKHKNYFKEIDTKKIYSDFGINLNMYFSENRTTKRFDFAIKTNNYLYLVEVNFYSSNGSKLNETARSYRTLNNELAKIPNIRFVWITDGIGWLSTKQGLYDAYNEIDYFFTIFDLENGILDKLD